MKSPVLTIAMAPFRRHPSTQVLFALLGVTAVIWVLRGFSLLAFLPGIVLWLLVLACVGAAIVSSLQKIR